MSAGIELRFPADSKDPSKCRVKFILHGQHISNVRITDDSFNWSSVADRSDLAGQLLKGHVSSNAWPDADIRCYFSPSALK